MGHDDSNDIGTAGRPLPVPPDREERSRYATPTVSDFGPLRRITRAGGPASTNDAFGAGMNMTKYTMIG